VSASVRRYLGLSVQVAVNLPYSQKLLHRSGR
jgi:hypothetical protein